MFGQKDKGTLNGVYTLLENNTDIIWARPNKKFGTVFSKKKDLDFAWGDNILDKPASEIRGFSSFSDIDWIARMRCNIMTGGGGDAYWSYAQAKQYGPDEYWHRGGHNICEFVRASHPFEKNPELYALIDGKRRTYGNNLCFTNEETKKVFISNALDTLRRAPSDIAGLYLALDDTYNWCECDKCSAPITLPDGTVVNRDDPAFQSTQAFLFVNDVAAAIVKEFPKYGVHFLAYFQTSEPPKCAVYPAITAQFAPYVRVNDKTPIYSPENYVWMDKLQRWGKKGTRLNVYGYNALGLGFPRPVSEACAKDFQEMYKYVRGIMAEGTCMQWGDQGGPNSESTVAMWDYSAIELWVMSQVYWDPTRDVEQLRKYYIARAFREAAPPMEKFYGTIREEWFKDSGASTLGDAPVPSTQKYIINTGHENELRGHLEEAEKLAKHPNSLEMIKRIRACFENYASAAHAIKTPTITLPLVRVEGKLDFDNACWRSAAEIKNLNKWLAPKEEALHKGSVKLFHDAKNLNFYFTFHETDMENLKRVANPDKKELVPEAPHVEIFLEDAQKPGEYYLFSVDPFGNAADLKAYDMKWNTEWTHMTRRLADRWEVIVSVPLAAIGGDIAKGDTVRGTFTREYYGKTKEDTEYSSWSGGKHHQVNTFGTLTLMR